MAIEANREQGIQEILDSVKDNFQEADLGKFTENAFKEAQRRAAQLIKDFLADCEREARREEDYDSIALPHVRHAYELLVHRKRKRPLRWMAVVGALLLGGTISTFLGMTLGFEYSPIGVAICLVVGIAGGIMLTLGMRED